MSGTIAAVILAGGLGRRMGGGDKPLVEIGGRPMLARVAERLSGQVEHVAINANGDPRRFSQFGLPVVADTIGGYAGPLAGILAGMRWARSITPHADAVVSVAADTPFFPSDLTERLAAASAASGGAIALAASEEGVHPVFGLWPLALADDLEAFLRSGAGGKILAFTARHARIDVHFDPLQMPDRWSVDPFFNVNTPEDAAEAEAIAAALDPPPA